MQFLKTPKSVPNFETRERIRQTDFLDSTLPDRLRHKGSAYRLPPDDKALLLAPSIREKAQQYFSAYSIAWHVHANHALSSQVCCVNFLMPLADQQDRLSALVGRALGIRPPKMIEVENGPDGQPWFVGFEWNGLCDYLNESTNGKPHARGANSTCADAIVRFKGDNGPETLLIEWKYTEKYSGSKLDEHGNLTRTKRYKDLIGAPNGPIRDDRSVVLQDFFYEPFYQLLRQQMLAYRMEAAQEAGSTRVRVLHISPAGNSALHRVTSPRLRVFGSDAFTVFRSRLMNPDQFVN